MAPVEIDTIPREIMAPVMNMKMVEKAFELPLVTSAYTEMAKIVSPITPYVENSLTTITPMVEVGINTIKTKVEESVIPCLPDGMSEKIQTNMSTAVEHVTAAVEKIDTFACGGIDQLTEKVPALKEATPQLIADTKETATNYGTAATNYLASFSLAQVSLKIVDSNLELVEQVFELMGVSEESATLSMLKKIHSTANTIRISGNKTAGTEKARKIEEASIIGALIEISGLNFLFGSLGLVDSTEHVVEEADVTLDDEVEEVEAECNTPACDKTAHKRTGLDVENF